MPKHEKVFVFLDTNIFLEYQEFTQIDWRTVTGRQEVCLVVTRINMQELDDFKYDPKSQRRQRRSRKISKKILDILQASGNLETEIPERPGVSLRYLTSFPNTENFPELRQNNNDDQMIASILEFKTSNPEIKTESIVLITADSGPQLLALHYTIPSIRLDDKFQLQPEPNQIEKRLKKLEEEFTELNQKPELDLQISGSEGNTSLFIEQSQRNTELAGFLSSPSQRLLSQINEVKNFHQSSARKKIDRSQLSNPLYSSLDIMASSQKFLEVDYFTFKEILEYTRKIGINLDPKLIQPVDVYTNEPLPIHYRSTAKGNDADWFEAVHELRDICELDAEERFVNISNCIHFPITLTIHNTGAVALKELSLRVTTNDLKLSRILPQFKTPQSDRENAAPAFKSIASDEQPEVYKTVDELTHYSKLLRPKDSEKITIGYLVVPETDLSGEMRVVLSAENLVEPVVEVTAVTFDQTSAEFQNEANFYKRLFEY